MQVTGKMLIGQSSVRGTAGQIRAFNPVLNAEIEPVFYGGGAEEVDRACGLAAEAFPAYRNLSPAARAAFMRTAADNIEALGDVLYDRLTLETGLPKARAEGETARTVAQFRMFADLTEEGRWRCATIDTADAQRKPTPRLDQRMQKIGIGPVAVFGSSNFPMLYSVAGGDTASALAAGCPVVVKAHGSHMGVSELVGRAIQKAVAHHGLPEGVFSLLIGAGNELGEALVDHHLIQAVGFTGSQGGGMALVRRGLARPQPIPVFAEMTSINPTFLLPSAQASRAAEFATRFTQQMTAGVGQMCLKPGMILALDGASYDVLRKTLSAEISKSPAATMLSPGILANYNREVANEISSDKVKVLVGGSTPSKPGEGQSHILEIDASDLLDDMDLASEMFGPSAMLVRCTDFRQMLEFAARMSGQLTATLQIDEPDMDLARELIPILETRTNRIIANSFSNMVEISHATIHGGPFPATSDPRFTSVGATAIDRFLRPISYQNLPATLLPDPIQDGNPQGLWRLVDGKPTRD
jgi:NADP-dependent aldehyde dehydrogenase